jgi:hypothetical protein
MIHELERTWKEAVVAHLRYCPDSFLKGFTSCQDSRCFGRDSNRVYVFTGTGTRSAERREGKRTRKIRSKKAS